MELHEIRKLLCSKENDKLSKEVYVMVETLAAVHLAKDWYLESINNSNVILKRRNNPINKWVNEKNRQLTIKNYK